MCRTTESGAGFFFGFIPSCDVMDERRAESLAGFISADRLLITQPRKGPGSVGFSATDETVLRDESNVKECGAATHTAVRFLFLVSWAVF